MPGVFGVVARGTKQDISPLFARMRATMTRGGQRIAESQIDTTGHWAMGRVHLGVLNPEPQLSRVAALQVLVHGEVFNQAGLLASVQTFSQQPPTTARDLVAALYLSSGLRCAAEMKASFCAAILDQDAGRLVLVSDRLGSYPLYWFRDDRVFAFASELRALLPVHPRPALNPETVNELIHFGFPLGDKTLAEGVRLLPAGSTLTCDLTSGEISIERYATWVPSFRRTNIDKPEYMEAVARVFDISMQRCAAGAHKFGLSLSGGLDTRVLLSALDRLHVPLSTFTLGGRGCADEVIGDQLAKAYGSQHQFVALEERYLADLLPMTQRMVSLTDGMYTSHGFTEMLALRSFQDSAVTVVLRGHAGELAKSNTAWPVHTDRSVFAMRESDDLVPHLLARFETLNHSRSSEGLFTAPWSGAYDESAARGALAESANVDLAPPDLCSYLYLNEFHRRVTVPSLEIFREAVEIRLPLADVDFLEMVFQGRPEWRSGVEIHQSLIARNSPTFLRVRNPNTGAPAGAGPLQEFVLDKVNTILRRLNVYGYRHYHAFDGWMRRAFLQTARQVLLDPLTLERGVVKESAVRGLVERAETGDAAPDHVLQVLMLVELWQRENL